MSLFKLAEQVQAKFGRPALDGLLRDSIPDLRHEPSKIHVDLLKLPWKDIFTTNYDTLLERARGSVALRHYDLVATKEDLLHAKSPRILKLHGSFPSPPFVITEEDYRRYPNVHAPFVNTVRQSLLENTFCLIGFSGDDPNFLQWIGWMRDHIGSKNAPKIYLIGVFSDLGEADRKVLDGRGIVTVDLSEFSEDPGDALSAFFDYLRDRRPRSLDWPFEPTMRRPSAGPMSAKDYVDIVSEWRRQREAYPGWVIVPEDRRKHLWFNTKEWLSRICNISAAERASLETPLDLDLAFELAWRLDRCLFPLPEKLPEFLKEVAEKYSSEDIPIPDHAEWERGAVFEAVSYIWLWLLRHYREEGRNDDWQTVRARIERDSAKLLPEQRAIFGLEEAMHALFCFNPAEARRRLLEWEGNEHPPFYDAKRAALLAELGEASLAQSILEASLQAIRKQIGLIQAAENLTLLSQESIVMLLLRSVTRGISKVESVERDKNAQLELSERWNDLKRHKCDPWGEIERLSSQLSDPERTGSARSTETHQFDLGIVRTTHHMGWDEKMVAAYGLLRLYEDMGRPYHMENFQFLSSQVAGAIARTVAPYSPHWALVNLVRLGDVQAVDQLFNREYLARLTRDEVDMYCKTYLASFKRVVEMIDHQESSEAKSFEALAKVLPEVFSRLCYKCSPQYRERLADLLVGIYRSRRRRFFVDAYRFTRRLLDSMTVSERVRSTGMLIALPAPDSYSDFDRTMFPNPLLHLKLTRSLPKEEVISGRENVVNDLLNQFPEEGPDRDWNVISLVRLHEMGMLDERQSKRFGDLLWEGVGDQAFPSVSGVIKAAYVNIPHPAEIDPVYRAREYLQKVAAELAETDHLGSDMDEFLEELHISAGNVNWSSSEAQKLLDTLANWWAKNKHLLEEDMPMLSTPLWRMATNIVNALSAVFLRLEDGNDDARALTEFAIELHQHGIPAIRLEAAGAGRSAIFREDILRRVAAGLVGTERDYVVDAHEAVIVLAQILPDDSRAGFEAVVAKLAEGIEWRHRTALAHRLNVAAKLIDDHPWCILGEREAILLHGLEHIAVETASGVKENDVDGVITIRAAAARLAAVLFKRHKEAGTEPPDVIERWRTLCEGRDEFVEVGNAWEEAVG